MRIFLYEYLSGGGLLDEDLQQSAWAKLLDEGRAMFAALAADLVRIEGHCVLAIRDRRLECQLPRGVVSQPVASRREEQTLFHQLSAAADGTLIIAPECQGLLLERCRWAEAAGARLLSPAAPFVAVAGDKQATAAALAAAGVPTPRAAEIPPGAALPLDFAWPAVLKPPDGAGSLETRHVADRAAAGAIPVGVRTRRLEQFCPGLPASVSLLCGPAGNLVLPAARQCLSRDGQYRYLGGSVPLGPGLGARAQRLARRALAAMPPSTGYVGVDLVLGHPADGSGDVVLEVNPRLTTSYTGLRRLCRGNLAAAMLHVARGAEVVLSWHAGPIRFDSSGRLSIRPNHGS